MKDELDRLWEVEEMLQKFCKDNKITLSGTDGDDGNLLRIESNIDPGLVTFSSPIHNNHLQAPNILDRSRNNIRLWFSLYKYQ